MRIYVYISIEKFRHAENKIYNIWKRVGGGGGGIFNVFCVYVDLKQYIICAASMNCNEISWCWYEMLEQSLERNKRTCNHATDGIHIHTCVLCMHENDLFYTIMVKMLFTSFWYLAKQFKRINQMFLLLLYVAALFTRLYVLGRNNVLGKWSRHGNGFSEG